MAFEDRIHYHRYQPYQVKKEFINDREADIDNQFIAIDYAYLFCNCGDVIKREVKEEIGED